MREQPPSAELFAGALGAALARRVLAATREARALIGAPVGRNEAADPAELAGLIATLGSRVEGGADALEEHARGLARLRGRYEARAQAIERITAAAEELRAIGSPQALLERVPRALVDASGLERVVLSRVSGGAMRVEAVHMRGAPRQAADALARLRAAPVRLAPPLIEAEIIRRRRGTIVTAAQTGDRAHRPLATVMGWGCYVAAAVIVRGDAVALIHADRGGSREVDALDRDVLWELADGVAHAYDRAALTGALDEERAQLHALLEWLGARAGELADTSLEPSVREPAALPGSGPPDPADRRDPPPAALGARLSARELEVLALLAAGRSNREIADELVLAAATVKFHTASILRKLGVRNRTGAAAHYLRLTGAAVI